MKLAILSRNRKLHSIQRLLQEAKKQKVDCAVFDPLDCQVIVGKASNQVFIGDRPVVLPDIILPRIGTSITDYGLAVVKQFELLGVKVVNDSQAIAESRDKLRCLQILADKGFDVPVTVLLRGSRGFKAALRKVHGAPAILKLIKGTQGVGVMLVESATSAESVVDTLYGLDHDLILQQFISESSGRDIRVFVIGDQVVASMTRKAKEGEFRSNIHRGGEGSLINLPEAYKKVAIRAAKAVGLSIAGVDLLESLTGPKILEINSSPGFEGIEKATGLNIAKMIIQHVREQVSKSRTPRRRRRKPTTKRSRISRRRK